MTKVREIIQDALIEIGAIDPRQSVEAEDAAFGLRTLNRMVSVWNNEELMVYTVNRLAFNFVAGQQSYTLGTGGNFNTQRPNKINMASVLTNTSGKAVEIPLKILTDEEWRQESVKATPGGFPTEMWITGDVPLNTLWFYPIPSNSSDQVVLYAWGRTSAFADVNTDVVFPDGYEEALVTNLAVALASGYGTQPSPSLSIRAAASKSALMGINAEPLYMTPGLGGGGSKAIRSFGYQID